MRALVSKLKDLDVPYRTQVCAKMLCSFRIGGTVAVVIEPRCEGELQAALQACCAAEIPFEILGNGSNVLFDDGELSLAVIRTTGLDAIRVFSDGIYAGCGVPLPRLCMLAATRGLRGLQAFCGIPGTLGGALAMNAGAHGTQIAQVVKSVKILDLASHNVRTDFNFGKNSSYRNTDFQYKNALFLGAELALKAGADTSCLLAEMQRFKDVRKATQPIETPSAGCAFKRPSPDLPIGKFLDELGCKGMCEGGATVSQKHAAFILNTGNASASDVKKLMQKIQKKAKKERGMILEPEIRIISNKA